MTKYFTNNFTVTNLHKKPSIKSEIVTQMIYGDTFSISKRSKNWLKIKIKEDGITNTAVMIKKIPQSPFNQSTKAPDDAAKVVLPAVPMEAKRAY